MTTAHRTLRTFLTDNEIKRFADAKFGGGALCPRCGAKDWQYIDESLTSETSGLGIIDKNNDPAGLYATIVFECENCGFVAPHTKSVIIKWLNEHE